MSKAKKTYTRGYTSNIIINAIDKSRSLITINGINTNDTPLEIKIEVDNWYFKHIAGQMISILTEHRRCAHEAVQQFKRAIDD